MSHAPRFVFRRNTHTSEGIYRGPYDPAAAAIGDGLYHWLSSSRGMTFAEWRRAMEEDDENWPDRSAPSEVTVALALVAMLETGLVEMVPDGWEAS